MNRIATRPTPSWVDRELYPFEGRWLELEGEGSPDKRDFLAEPV